MGFNSAFKGLIIASPKKLTQFKYAKFGVEIYHKYTYAPYMKYCL